MKRIVFLIAMVCMTWVGARGQDSQLARTGFEGKRITGLVVFSAWEVAVRQGEDTGARIEFPERFEKNIVFSLGADGVLRRGLKGKIKGHRKGEVFKAEVVCNSLEQVKLSGACDLKGEGDFTGRRASLDLSGAGDVVFEGKWVLEESLQIVSSGAGDVKIEGLEVPSLVLKSSGASDVKACGKVEEGHFEVSGASEVDFRDVAVQRAYVDLSGAAGIRLHTTELISGKASGASSLKYAGSPVVEVKVSGAADLRHLR